MRILLGERMLPSPMQHGSRGYQPHPSLTRSEASAVVLKGIIASMGVHCLTADTSSKDLVIVRGLSGCLIQQDRLVSLAQKESLCCTREEPHLVSEKPPILARTNDFLTAQGEELLAVREDPPLRKENNMLIEKAGALLFLHMRQFLF